MVREKGLAMGVVGVNLSKAKYQGVSPEAPRGSTKKY
jgi:hypothetical protein